MGYGFYLQCKHCGNCETVALGVGLLGSSLRNMIESVPLEQRPVVLDILDNHHVASTDYEYRLFTCPRCNTLQSRFYTKIEYDDEKVYESPLSCDRCEAGLVPVWDGDERTESDRWLWDPSKDNYEDYNCKRCGRKGLEADGEICWD